MTEKDFKIDVCTNPILIGFCGSEIHFSPFRQEEPQWSLLKNLLRFSKKWWKSQTNWSTTIFHQENVQLQTMQWSYRSCASPDLSSAANDYRNNKIHAIFPKTWIYLVLLFIIPFKSFHSFHNASADAKNQKIRKSEGWRTVSCFKMMKISWKIDSTEKLLWSHHQIDQKINIKDFIVTQQFLSNKYKLDGFLKQQSRKWLSNNQEKLSSFFMGCWQCSIIPNKTHLLLLVL